MNSVKIKVILKWKTFKDVKEIFSFHDFINFYRHFIENFNLKILFLIRLTNKNVFFIWINKEQKVFDDFKQVFVAESILTHYNLEQKFQVQINVFDEMIDDVLFQRNIVEIWQFVAYFFKKMIFAKCNYEIYNKKFLIVIKVFEKWRPELKESKFFVKVITDHKNLEYFMFNKLFNRRQTRWSKFLFRFNFKIIYRFGK